MYKRNKNLNIIAWVWFMILIFEWVKKCIIKISSIFKHKKRQSKKNRRCEEAFKIIKIQPRKNLRSRQEGKSGKISVETQKSQLPYLYFLNCCCCCCHRLLRLWLRMRRCIACEQHYSQLSTTAAITHRFAKSRWVCHYF